MSINIADVSTKCNDRLSMIRSKDERGRFAVQYDVVLPSDLLLKTDYCHKIR